MAEKTKTKIRPDKVKMSEQDPKKRIKNFEEVALGYADEQAILEAERCLQCKNPPCVKGCPVEVDIPGFIARLKEKDFEGAIRRIKETNILPAVCGRVCPQEDQCEAACVLAKKFEPVAIGRLERFAADKELAGKVTVPVVVTKSTGKKVAVVGAGPAGLTIASDLAKQGHKVVIFEALHEPGGVLTYGIPEFRLPMKIVQSEIEGLKKMGVEIKTNTVVGKLITVKELLNDFDAVFLGIGAGLPLFMNIPGENLNGVYSANEFLTRVNLMKAYLFPEYDTPIKRAKKVAVVGGGNVAMDSARTALRLGAEKVYLVYRRSEEEMPARIEEVHHAQEEGIIFQTLTNPVEILGKDNFVTGIKCVKMELGEPDESGRRRPIPIPGSESVIDVDAVIMAIGTRANPLVPSTTSDLKLNKWGYIEADDVGKTSLEKVYAGGDIVTGSATVILAMGAGRTAARVINKNLENKNPENKSPENKN
ncbi:MAG TPA: NADPH-dependent glutamate synthase [Candidatus Subteraquimicrobiales bacterium]